MIDPEKLAQLKTAIAGKEKLKTPLADLPEKELRQLRDEINRMLPEDAVGTLNLEGELVSQYRKIKDLMDEVLADQDCPANQKAQCANSVVSTLGSLVKLQEDLKREQTLKIMEEVLVDSLKALPEETRTAFYLDYERLAAQVGLM